MSQAGRREGPQTSSLACLGSPMWGGAAASPARHTSAGRSPSEGPQGLGRKSWAVSDGVCEHPPHARTGPRHPAPDPQRVQTQEPLFWLL